jgi:DNA polymerase-3 subunit epsilon
MPVITAIDFETAWYRPHSAIALGLTRIEDGKIVETRSWLCRPPGKGRIYIRPEFIALHGITPERLAGKPEFPGVWPEIEPYFKDVDILLAHNARFDRNVLYSTAYHFNMELPAFNWVCTVDVSRVTWPDLENHKLSTVARHLEIPLNHHDAASDAEACANIYLRAMEVERAKAKAAVEAVSAAVA